MFGDEAIKRKASDGISVVRERGVLGPSHFDLGAKAKGTKSVVLVTVRSNLRFEPHLLELVHRARGEAITAGLFAREDLLLNETDIPTSSSQPIGRRAARRSASNNGNIKNMRWVWVVRGGHADTL